MEEEIFGEQLLEELETGKVAGAGHELQRVGIPEADGGEPGVLDFIEEYAMLAIIIAVLSYFIYKSLRKWYEEMLVASAARRAEDNMKRARLLQQAKFELESAKRAEELAKIEEQKRMQKLEEMEAMQEGRSARKPEVQKKTDLRDYWDNAAGFNHMGGGGGGGGGRYKPATKKRG